MESITSRFPVSAALQLALLASASAQSDCNNTSPVTSDPPGETWQIAVTLPAVVMMLAAMAYEFAPADMLMMTMLIFVLAVGIVTPKEAMSGFSNTGMLTVAVLLIVADAVRKTGAINPVKKLLGSTNASKAQPLPIVLMRFMLPVTILSAFMNNTPVVAMMIPVIVEYSDARNLKPSKLLIPLSYASIFGGTCTLMGTSTNLVVVGLAKDKDPDFEMSLFEIGMVGLPVALAGMLFVALFGAKYLPNRVPPLVDDFLDVTPEYVVTFIVKSSDQVSAGPPLADKTVGDIELRKVVGLQLVKIERQITSHLQARTILRPDSDTELHEGDQLFFAGPAESMYPMTQNIDPGLLMEFAPQVYMSRNALCNEYQLAEVKIGKQSPLIGKNLRELKFRSRYNAKIISVYRLPGRQSNSPSKTHSHDRSSLHPVGTLEVQQGDSYLILADPDFKDRYDIKHDTDFASVADLSVPVPRSRTALIATLLCIAMVCANIAGISLLTAALVTTILLVKTNCLHIRDIYASLNLPVLVVIAAAFGISAAMVNSGSAALIARGLVAASAPSGILGLQIVIYVVTVVFSACVTNNAAVTIMFPIAHKAAEDVGEDFRPFLYLIMMGASASFMTPTGYQTNLMVYSPGGYRFSDFIKFGGVLQLWIGVVTIALLQTLEFWWLWTLALGGILSVAVLLLAGFNIRTPVRRGRLGRSSRTSSRSTSHSPVLRQRSRGMSRFSSDLSQDLKDMGSLNIQPGQRYTFVPDLGLVPIDPEDGDELESQGTKETDSLI